MGRNYHSPAGCDKLPRMTLLGFSDRTNAWQGALASLDDGAHGGMPFLLAWIQKESDGNPCSFPPSTHEAGIWQLMPASVSSDGGGNLATAGTTVTEQHPVPPCAGTETSKSISDLTGDQIAVQVSAGATYLNYCISTVQTALQNNGSPIDQTSPDFWRFVKLVHAAPAWVINGIGLVSQQLGAPVSSWDDFESTATSLGCWGSKHCSDALANARSVGAYGGSDPQPSIEDQLIVLAGPQTGLSAGEIALVALASIAGVFGAVYFQRWLTGRGSKAI
jgi:hypothetical protein